MRNLNNFYLNMNQPFMESKMNANWSYDRLSIIKFTATFIIKDFVYKRSKGTKTTSTIR